MGLRKISQNTLYYPRFYKAVFILCSPVPGRSCTEVERLQKKVAELEKSLKHRTDEMEAKELDVATCYRAKLQCLFTDQQVSYIYYHYHVPLD